MFFARKLRFELSPASPQSPSLLASPSCPVALSLIATYAGYGFPTRFQFDAAPPAVFSICPLVPDRLT